MGLHNAIEVGFVRDQKRSDRWAKLMGRLHKTRSHDDPVHIQLYAPEGQKAGEVSVKYSSTFSVHINRSGVWALPEQGHVCL